MALSYRIWCDVGYIQTYNADTERVAMSWRVIDDGIGGLDYWSDSLPPHPVHIPDFEHGNTPWL
jgi:hypothetical protein